MIVDMPVAAWGAHEFGGAIAMWIVMMSCMMLPTVVPWMLACYRIASSTAPSSHPPLVAGLFMTGYLLAWSGYSIGAAGVQWAMHDGELLSSMGALRGPVLGGSLLVLAGVFQWTSLKDRCLAHCQSPLGFFLTAWRPGRAGAIRMGLDHGLYCVSCCWALMALALVAGVMSLVWMAGVTLFVFIDQTLLRSAALTRTAGVGLVVWGLWTLAASVL